MPELWMSVDIDDVDHAEVSRWRNEDRGSLRTPTMSDPVSQSNWFFNLDTNVHRYWGFVGEGGFVAFGGLTFISPENRSAEISLIVDPDQRRRGVGMESVRLLLHEGFHNMNLRVIYGEVYHCNPGRHFWRKVYEFWNAETAELPKRKYWDGKYFDSTYFAITRQDEG